MLGFHLITKNEYDVVLSYFAWQCIHTKTSDILGSKFFLKVADRHFSGARIVKPSDFLVQ